MSRSCRAGVARRPGLGTRRTTVSDTWGYQWESQQRASSFPNPTGPRLPLPSPTSWPPARSRSGRIPGSSRAHSPPRTRAAKTRAQPAQRGRGLQRHRRAGDLAPDRRRRRARCHRPGEHLLRHGGRRGQRRRPAGLRRRRPGNLRAQPADADRGPDPQHRRRRARACRRADHAARRRAAPALRRCTRSR